MHTSGLKYKIRSETSGLALSPGKFQATTETEQHCNLMSMIQESVWTTSGDCSTIVLQQ